MEKRRRRDIIRELIDTSAPGSQMELVEELAARGIVIDQSTVSRDLREMGVVRLPGREGGMVYGFPGERTGPADREELHRRLQEFIIDSEASGNLVVLHTAPGNAQALAAVLDRAQLGDVVGTVAGDDTIMVVVRGGFSAREMADWFNEMAH